MFRVYVVSLKGKGITMEIKENMKISPIIYGAIEIMKKSFGGTDVQLLSTEMYRLPPDEFAKAGRLGVDITINGVKTFLGHESMAEDIACTPYGQMIADDFVYTIIKNGNKNR